MAADVNAAFAAWLRTSRKEAGLSQQKVADVLNAEGFNFFQTTIHKIESGGRPVRLDEAAALVTLFGSTLDVALGLTPDLTKNFCGARDLAARTALLTQIRASIDAELGGAA